MSQHPVSGTRVTVSSAVDVPGGSADVWARLSRPEAVPGTITGGEDGRALTFLHTGASGWLPLRTLTGELRVEPRGAVTRVSLSLTAEAVGSAFESVVRRRLASYAASSLASRLRAA